MTEFAGARLPAILAVALVLSGVGSVHASVVTSGCANTNVSCALQELFDGATITVGDKLFADFGFESDFPTDGVDPARIEVVPLDIPANPGLRFSGGGELAVTGTDFLELAFGFRVRTTSGEARIVGDTLELTEFEFTGDGGRILIVGTAFDADLAFMHDHPVEADQLFGTFQLVDTAAFVPQAELFIEIDISLAGDFAGETAELLAFEQRLSQREVPEPGSLVVVILGLVAFGVGTWRRERAPHRRLGRQEV